MKNIICLSKTSTLLALVNKPTKNCNSKICEMIFSFFRRAQ